MKTYKLEMIVQLPDDAESSVVDDAMSDTIVHDLGGQCLETTLITQIEYEKDDSDGF